MAVEKIALGINLRKNKISTSSGFGKYYPEVDVQKTLSLRGFAQHMVDHGSIYGRAVVEGVLLQIVDCLPELVAQGVPVQLGSLGTFYPTAEVTPKTGAVANIAAMDGLNPNDIVKAIHIRYERHREGHPHPLPARLDETGQPVRSEVQEPLYVGAAQHHRHAGGDHQWQDEEGADLEAHCYGCGRVEGWQPLS